MRTEPATLTILRPKENWALPAKTITFENGRYVVLPETNPGKLFDVEEVSVQTVADVARALKNAVDQRAFAIHGHLKKGRRPFDVRRRRGQDDDFEDRGTRVCFVDVDSVPFPTGYQVDDGGFLLPDKQGGQIDPDPMIEHLRRMLPAAFHEAACHWYLTGSFGAKPGARVRLVFMLDHVVPISDLQRWFGGARRLGEPPVYPVDTSIYRTVQPIFFQPPVIAAGAEDPVAALNIPRSGFLDGTPLVEVPLADLRTVAVEITRQRRPAAARIDGAWDAPLAEIGDQAGYHEPLRSAINAYFRTACEGDDRTAAALSQHLVALLSTRQPTRRYDEAYLRRRIADVPGWCERVEAYFRRQRADEALRRAGAVTRHPDKGGSPQDAHEKLIEGFDRLSEALAKRRELRRFLGEHEEAGRAIRVIEAQAPRQEPSHRAPMGGVSLLSEAAELWACFSTELAPAVVKMTVGGGKTHQTILWALKEADRGERVVIAVPNHQNAGEVVDRIRRAAVNLPRLSEGRQIVSVWRGVEQRADEGGSMCLDLERMRAGIEAGLAQESMCGSGRDRCAFFKQCAYRAQGRQSPLIWVVTHQQLAYAPREAMARPTILIVDERLPINGEPLAIDLVELSGSVQRLLASDADRAAVANIIQTLSTQPDGELKRDRAARLRADVCHGLRYRLFAANPTPADAYLASQLGGSALTELGHRRASIDAGQRLLSALAEFLTGAETAAGRIVLVAENGRPTAKVFDRRAISPTWAGALVVALDATAELAIARAQFGPGARMLVEARIEASNAIVTQTVDFSGSYLKLGKANGWPDAELYERLAKCIAARVDQDIGGTRRPLVGIIGPMELIECMRPWFLEWGIADYVFGHFYALRGLNNFENVDALIVIGAPRTSPQVLENQHRTLFGTALSGTPVQRFVALRTAGNAPVMVEERAFNDERADALVRTSHDAEVEQAVGRARAVRRTTPLSICVVNCVALDLTVTNPVEAAVLFEGASPDVASLVDGIAWDEAPACAAAYPHRFTSAAARWKNDQRKRDKNALSDGQTDDDRTPDNALYGSYKGEVRRSAPLVGRAKVRSSGSRKRWNATVDLRTARTVDELQAVLDRHGLLTGRAQHLTVESFDAPAEPERQGPDAREGLAQPFDISGMPIERIVKFARERDPSFDVDAVPIHLIDIAREVGVTIYTLDAMKQHARRAGRPVDQIEEFISLELLKAAGPARIRAVTENARRRRLAIDHPHLFAMSTPRKASTSLRL